MMIMNIILCGNIIEIVLFLINRYLVVTSLVTVINYEGVDIKIITVEYLEYVSGPLKNINDRIHRRNCCKWYSRKSDELIQLDSIYLSKVLIVYEDGI